MAILLSPAITEAASMTINSPEMQAIFSQSTFDGTPISIRFNAPREIVAPLVQTDSAGQRFIQITPIAIVAAPEPSTPLLAGAAPGALLVIEHKRRRYLPKSAA